MTTRIEVQLGILGAKWGRIALGQQMRSAAGKT